MTCYSPITLYKSRQGRNKKTGNWPLVGIVNGYRDLPVDVPCSRCIGCRLERSRQWAIRCVNESKMHKENCFLTLTYKDEELVCGDKGYTLYPLHLQLFMKRLRKRYGKGIKFFACGEYGDRTNRPHYHACIFGMDFEDKKLFSIKNDIRLYTSVTLDALWGHGMCSVGAVSFESAAYVARYIMDKKLGFQASYYTDMGIEPEFVRMSRRPGIGSTFYDKFFADMFPQDFCIIRNGVKSKPPRFYFNKFLLDNPDEAKYIKFMRRSEAYKRLGDSTYRRLRDRELVKLAQIKSLRR